jgi:hypothetical protein
MGAGALVSAWRNLADDANVIKKITAKQELDKNHFFIIVSYWVLNIQSLTVS